MEVLVSIIILSFGLLGMVGMQASALQANKEARLQSSAVRLARELGEMMRGNKDVGTATTALANPYLINYTNPAAIGAAPTNCFTGNCYTVTGTPGKLAVAQFEVQDWLTRVNSELPGVRVVVCFDDTPFDASGMPQWACSAAAGTVAVIKIGWTRGSTNRAPSAAASGAAAAFDRATVPSIILPVTAGSTT